MRRVRDQSFLLIERYDRTRDADGRLVRLHQEDFAQALGVPSQRKYASEGGPTFKDSFALLRQAATRSEEHTSELQSLMRISYAVLCLKKKNIKIKHNNIA